MELKNINLFGQFTQSFKRLCEINELPAEIKLDLVRLRKSMLTVLEDIKEAGDNRETAFSIAKEVGLTGEIIDGQELDELSDEELKKKIKKISIFARVRPEHKIRIVKALKDNGEIVTMTGDGINDAPALKEAHIGIAMGKNGTDVSRSVSDIILKDDNFSTIVLAIKEGRTIFKNN